jgi:hypothetical protein
MQCVYKVSMEDLIVSIINTSILNVVLVLKNVIETLLIKAKPHAKDFIKIIKTRQKTLNSNFYKYFYSHLRIFYILFYLNRYICVY